MYVRHYSAFEMLDLFSVPTVYAEPKGRYVLEALASGVPVVQPAHGAFPEMLAQVDNEKVGLVVGVAKSLCDKVPAPELMAVTGPLVGAKGGGRPDLARAGGGDNPAGLRCG